MTKSSQQSHPSSKVMVLCHTTICEAQTLRWSLINVFTHWKTNKFPLTIPSFRLYAQLVDGEGEYGIVVEIRDLRLGETLCRSGMMRFRMRDRLEIEHLSVPIPPMTLSHDGKYDIVLLADGQEVERQQLTVLDVRQKQ